MARVSASDSLEPSVPAARPRAALCRWSTTPNDCVTALRALGEETRVRIVALLMEQPMDVGAISTTLGVSPYNVSKHLRVLREAGLLEVEKEGRLRRYALPRASSARRRPAASSISGAAASSSTRTARRRGRTGRPLRPASPPGRAGSSCGYAGAGSGSRRRRAATPIASTLGASTHSAGVYRPGQLEALGEDQRPDRRCEDGQHLGGALDAPEWACPNAWPQTAKKSTVIMPPETPSRIATAQSGA